MTEKEIHLLETELKPQGTMINPFPGLRPFGIEESHLFFGREGQSDEVLKKLGSNKFVAVVGASGSGKSSLMYCGLISTLYGGFMTHAGSRWKVIVTRPGNNPIENLSESLLLNNDSYVSADEESRQITKNITHSILKSNSLGLVEALRAIYKDNPENTFLLIDQFEEIFRYKKKESKNSPYNEAFSYVNLIISAVQQSDVPVYIAITLRSDFVGECAQYPALTKLINASQYLVPQMTRDQKRQAIEGPVSVGGGKITPQLVQQLLNDVGDSPDQLPVLQHALMRTWDLWVVKKGLKEPLDIHHYDAIGRLSEALSRHANEAYEELSPKEKEICEILFKALTEKRNDSFGIRRPCRLEVISSIAGVTNEEIVKVVEKFRQPGRSLLIPGIGAHLDGSSVIEISHESLMRIWSRLKIWVDEEYEAAQMYLRLSEAAANYQVGKAGLWRNPDLQLALNWRQKYQPTLDWAQRYDPAFERAMVFLESSNKAFQEETRNKERMQKRTLQRANIVALILGFATVISILFFVWGQDQKMQADKNNENTQKQKIAAEKNALEANRNRKKAEKAQIEAELRRLEAEKAIMLANTSAEEAFKQQKIALYNQQIAELQNEIAEKSRREAVKQSQIAKYQSELAKQQEIIATQKTMEAYNLLLLSLGQSMAVKSTQIADLELKALLAKQAFLFYKKTKGNINDPYIYDGLYYALKQFEGPDFNILKGHTDNVRGIVITRNGASAYSTGSDGKLLKWNLKDSSYEVLNSSTSLKRTLALSPDEKWLAVGGNRSTIDLYDLSKEELSPVTLKHHKGAIFDLIFDHNGLYSLGADKTVKYYNFSSITDIYNAENVTRALAVNPAKKSVAIGNDNGEIILFSNIEDRYEEVIFRKQGIKFHSIAFSKDGKYLAAGDESGIIRLWDLKSRTLVNTLSGHSAIIRKIVFSDDNKVFASSGFDGKVILWHLDNLNDPPNIFQDHQEYVWSLSFSADGSYLLAGCGNGKIKFWPSSSESLANSVCSKISRNLTQKEWERYIGLEIPFETTCPELAIGINEK